MTSVSLLTLTPYKRVPKALAKVTDMANTSKPELKSHQRARDIAISAEDTRTSTTSNNTTTTTTSMRSLNQTAQERGQRVKATSDQSLHKLFVLSKNPNNLHSPGLIQSIK